MTYGVTLGIPKEFYHESHRIAHFVHFSDLEQGSQTGEEGKGEAPTEATDREDLFG